MKNLYLIVAGICIVFGSCVSGVGGETVGEIIRGSSESPIFLSCRAVSESEIHFEFSKPVKVVSLRFSPEVQLDEVENGSTIQVCFSKGLGPGERLTADILAEDSSGNTINVLVPLRARNNRIPALVINELRTEYSKPKCEFIELKTLQAGNLGALRVFIAGNNKAPMVYEFPSIEVKSGEYITLHLRTTEESNCDELGSNLEESGGSDSSPTARDIWIPGSNKLLHKTDAIYLLDQDDLVVDAVMISESADPWWNKDYLAEAAEFLYEASKSSVNGSPGRGLSERAWKSPTGTVCSPADAIRSTGTTLTRTICRDETVKENSGTAVEWYITANSSATPGKPNNPKRYTP